MKLLSERFNDEVICNSFIDEFDRFDEFDLEWISKDYDERIIFRTQVSHPAASQSGVYQGLQLTV